MPRKSSIWWNEYKKAYYTKMQGKQIRLAQTKEEAEQVFAHLHRQEQAPGQSANSQAP